MLPVDVKVLILCYFPFKKLQIINDSNIDFSTLILTNLLICQNVNKNVITNQFTQFLNKTILTPFELYCNIIVNLGQIGYNSQFYLLPYMCILNSIKNGDLDLLNYYVLISTYQY